MCDTYIDSVGYICYECQREFEEYLKRKGGKTLTRGKLLKRLNKFMESSNEYISEDRINVDDFFKEHTRE